MDRLRARVERRLNNDIPAQIAVRRGRAADMNGFIRHGDMFGPGIRIRIDGHASHAHGLGRFHDPTGNFAPVGNQNGVKHGRPRWVGANTDAIPTKYRRDTDLPFSHPEHAKACLLDRRVQGGTQAQMQHITRLARVNHPVIPQPGRGIKRMRLFLEHIDGGLLEGRLFLRRPGAARPLDSVAFHRCQNARRLRAPHDGNARIGPGPQETRGIGAPRHAIVAGPKRSAHQHRDFRHRSRGHRRHHLGPVARDAFVFVFAAHHKAGDILQENQRDAALAAQLDEMCALLRGLGKQHAIIGNDAHRAALDMGETADQRFAKPRLERVKARAIDDARDHLVDVIGRAQIRRNDAKDIVGVIGRLFRTLQSDRAGFAKIKVCDTSAGQSECVRIIFGQIIRHTGQARMHVAPAQILGTDDLARRRLDQGRARKKDSALFFNDNCHIRHGGHIGPPGGTRPHHHSDLRDAFGTHLRLIEKNAAKVVPVRKDLVLIGQVRPAAVDQVDAGQAILLGDLLGAQVFFDGHGIIGAALYGGVVANHHNLVAHDPANARDHTRTRSRPIIKTMRCRRPDLKKGRARIKQIGDPVTRQHLAPADMARARSFPAPFGRGLRHRLHLGQGGKMRVTIGPKRLGPGQCT
mmetsp:Transcript_22728/g.37564  ORF Transcript_22728/g.37564 Transcript_22728/m.37564 type:complete len:635 (-) Transcript_22728:3304-5208(-)